MLAMLEKPSLVDLAVIALRERITQGIWPLGTRIPVEPDLAASLGISRNTVREAVRVLAFCGVLDVRQGDGTYVASRTDPVAAINALSRASPREHLEARALLEMTAARLAAVRRTDADLAALRAALAQRGELAEYADPAEFARHDLVFHRATIAAAHNAVLTALYDFFSDAIREGVINSVLDETLSDPDLASHVAVYDAIAAGDGEAAADAARLVIQPLLDDLARR
ncbi:FadR/GntR family transcriptional regulator [Chitiniphilus eburneus]|uniref:FadR family transcriptional regulator n=1 Tax=Chitiniphilus eburneus TaxID=2571148 RepID=A0A4U0Q048_9NEIS|nr:FCD domain-containing protein [Chitiniphilus eburneus]TJZ73322.1 FadR family transcriptional regulator [Chitiniphilus eburneus]